MHTIVHIGLAKTGTTSLQSFLRDRREYLLAHKILYPKNPSDFTPPDHAPISGLLRPYSRTTRHLHEYFEGEDLYEVKLDRYVDCLKEQLSSNKPKALILSSEKLAHPIGRLGKINTFKALCGPELRFLMYIRLPSQRYVSAVMEKLKGSDRILHYKPRIFKLIKSYESYFGDNCVDVKALDKNLPNGSDVVSNFLEYCSHFFSVPDLPAEEQTKKNQSISAESLLVLFEYRKFFFKGQENKYVNQTRRLVRILQKQDELDCAKKAQLKTHIIERIDYSSDEILRLRDQKNIVIPGYDYARIEGSNFADPMKEPSSLDEIFSINYDRFIKILNSLVSNKWCSEAEERRAWAKGLVETSKP
jgi:hypothetical protein